MAGIRQRRMARINDVVLLNDLADATGPRSINCDSVEVKDVAALGADWKKFKLDPQSLLDSLRYKHNAEPPDFEMVLIQDERPGWVNTANLVLLGELRRRAPHAIDWGRLTAAGIVQMLDPRPRAGIDRRAAAARRSTGPVHPRHQADHHFAAWNRLWASTRYSATFK
jgi:hypothetical protein